MIVSAESAPALGDIRAAESGVTVWLRPGVERRKDWGRYLDALVSAITRGVDVRWAR